MKFERGDITATPVNTIEKLKKRYNLEKEGGGITEIPDPLTIDNLIVNMGASFTGDVNVSGDIYEQGAKLATRYQSNRNLLDNWYFVGGGSQNGYGVFPINQRGQGSYSGSTYAIDRWKTADSNSKVTLSSGYITVASTSASYRGFLCYRFADKNLRGKQVTGSMLLSDGTLCSGTLTINSADGSRSTFYDTGNFSLFYESTATVDQLTVAVPANASRNIVAMKLELGTTQTLAHQENGNWVLNEIPDYEEELRKCQTYLLRIEPYWRVRADFYYASNGIFDFTIPTPTSMRSKPSISGTLTFCKWDASSTAQTGFTFAVQLLTPSAVIIRATKANNGLTDGCIYATSAWYLTCEP